LIVQACHYFQMMFGNFLKWRKSPGHLRQPCACADPLFLHRPVPDNLGGALSGADFQTWSEILLPRRML